MSNKISIQVKKRTGTGNGASRRYRRAGLIPAIIYGNKAEGEPITVANADYRPHLNKDIHLVDLVHEDGNVTLALLKEVQFDYLKDQIIHIDFQAVRMDEIIHIKVAIHSVGIPAGIGQGGILEQATHEIEIACKANAIPEAITVDVSNIELGKAIHVNELVLPEGVKSLSDAHLIVFQVMEPTIAEEAPVAEPTEDADSTKTAESSEKK